MNAIKIVVRCFLGSAYVSKHNPKLKTATKFQFWDFPHSMDAISNSRGSFCSCVRQVNCKFSNKNYLRWMRAHEWTSRFFDAIAITLISLFTGCGHRVSDLPTSGCSTRFYVDFENSAVSVVHTNFINLVDLSSPFIWGQFPHRSEQW